MTVYPTIAEVLTRGGEKLAVDRVSLIGESGVYPQTFKGQALLPRYEFFQQIIEAFCQSGRSVATGAPDGYGIIPWRRSSAWWNAMKSGPWESGGWDPGLFETCLCRSHALVLTRDGFNHVYPAIDQMPGLVRLEPIAYRIEYAAGLKVTMLPLEGLVGDFTFASRLKGRREFLSTLTYVPHPQQGHFFNPLINNIEKKFLTG